MIDVNFSNPNSTFDDVYSNPEHLKASVIQWVSYSNKKLSIYKDDYPVWMSRNTDPYQYLCNLIAEGYLTKCDLENKLLKLTIPELKDILSKSGLNPSGKKSALIKNIIDHVDAERLKIPDVVQITDKGKKFIEYYTEKVTAFNLNIYHIQAKSYFDYKENHPNKSMDDILLDLLSAKEKQADDFSTLYAIQSKLRDLYMKKGDKTSAMQHSIFLAYYSVCSIHNINLQTTNFNVNDANRLYELKDYYKKSMVAKCLEIPLPFNHYPPDIADFRKAVESALK